MVENILIWIWSLNSRAPIESFQNFQTDIRASKLWFPSWGNWLNLIHNQLINQAAASSKYLASAFCFLVLIKCNHTNESDVYSFSNAVEWFDDLINSDFEFRKTKRTTKQKSFCLHSEWSAGTQDPERELVSEAFRRCWSVDAPKCSGSTPGQLKFLQLKLFQLQCLQLKFLKLKVSIARKRLLFNQNNLIIFVYKLAFWDF